VPDPSDEHHGGIDVHYQLGALRAGLRALEGHLHDQRIATDAVEARLNQQQLSLQQMQSHLTQLRTQVEEQATPIDKLETFRARMTAMGAVLVAIGGIIVSLWYHLGDKLVGWLSKP
jgi:hypothetical protein